MSENQRQGWSPPGEQPSFSREDAYFRPENIKLFNILSYVNILWLIGLFAARGNSRVRFHVNQGIILTIFVVVLNIAVGIACALLGLLMPIPVVNAVVHLLIAALRGAKWLVTMGFMVIGIVNAAKDRDVPLPIIGELFTILR